MLSFRVEARSGIARAGVLSTAHGDVATPAFQPVATQASVKALSAEDVAASGARLVIMNTYHLWVRPSPELIAEQGGLHAFSRWPHAITTDSGGFQAFSLAERTKLDDDGYEFASHLDGRRLRLTPEEAMRIQGLLGSDIAMQLDVCPKGGAPLAEVERALERTTRWGERCLATRSAKQAVFGIVQGGTHVELRLRHAEELARLPFDGLALGGFSVGEPIPEMHRALTAVAPILDEKRPRYLMGVGTPADIIHAIGCGVDMFDCVMPTRNARNGQAFVPHGKLVIKNARYRSDPRPLAEGCPCPPCRAGYSRSYLRHLFLSHEILAHRWLSLHNIFFYQTLISDARRAILSDSYASWSQSALSALALGDSNASDSANA